MLHNETENYNLLKHQKNHIQKFSHFLKSKLLVLPHQSASVCIPTNVCYYKCASNTWLFLKFDNQLAVRQHSHTHCLHARSSCQQVFTQHRFPYKFSGQCFFSDFFSFRGHHLCFTPPPSWFILQYHTMYCQITSKERYMKHVYTNVDTLHREISEYVEGILKEILQRVLTFFGRYGRSVLKIIVVNCSVPHLNNNN